MLKFLSSNSDWLGGIIGVGLLDLGCSRIPEGLLVRSSPAQWISPSGQYWSEKGITAPPPPNSNKNYIPASPLRDISLFTPHIPTPFYLYFFLHFTFILTLFPSSFFLFPLFFTFFFIFYPQMTSRGGGILPLI